MTADPNARQTVLWLLRHTEPDDAVAGRCYGSLDVALSAEGIQRAHENAETLAAEEFSAIYTSPLQRCTEAARVLAAGRTCVPVAMDALRELDFGDFEGLSYKEIAECHPELYRQWMERPAEVQFPGGECLREMQLRVAAAERELRARHAGESIALVTHGGVIRILLAEALGMDLNHVFRIGQGYGAINRIRYFGETPVVELVNARASA